MRKLEGHKVNGCNEAIEIYVVDGPGSGGACHRYDIVGFDTENNPSRFDGDGYAASFSRSIILFQNGPIKEAGTNGVTHEALLEILIDRLRCFEAGPYACAENKCALNNLLDAQKALKSRTEKRLARGVEGTHTV